MERDAVCFSGTGLAGGEQGLLSKDGTSTDLGNCGGLKVMLLVPVLGSRERGILGK